jgi:hypothetical protein
MNGEIVMRLIAGLLLGAITGITPALAQTSTSTPASAPATSEGQSNKSDRSDSQTPATTTSEPKATGTYRGTGSSSRRLGGGSIKKAITTQANLRLRTDRSKVEAIKDVPMDNRLRIARERLRRKSSMRSREKDRPNPLIGTPGILRPSQKAGVELSRRTAAGPGVRLRKRATKRL